MPAPSPERVPFSQLDPRELRRIASSFGSDADRYDRARPRYPDAMVERIVATSSGPDVLDVGVGTGIAARQFQDAGCRVLGVDVDPRMADRARRHGLAVEVAAFEAWDPAGRTFDAVVAGQAWHWVDPVDGAAKAADVLRPGGRWAVFWNVLQPPPALAEAFSAVYRRVVPGPVTDMWTGRALDGYVALAARATDGVRQVGGFDEPEQWRFEWARAYTRDEWFDQLPTLGGHARLSPTALEDLVAGVGHTVDSVGGSFTAHYTVVVGTAQRTGSA